MKRLCALIMGLSFLIPSLSVKADEEVKLDDFLKGENSSAILYSNVNQKDTTTREIKTGDKLSLSLVTNSISNVDSFYVAYDFDNTALQYDGAIFSDGATNDFTDKLEFVNENTSDNSSSSESPDPSVSGGESSESGTSQGEGVSAQSNVTSQVLQVGLSGKDGSKFSLKGGLVTLNFTALKDFTLDLDNAKIEVHSVVDGQDKSLDFQKFNLADYLTSTGLTDPLSNSEVTQVTVTPSDDSNKDSDTNSGGVTNDSGIHININNNNGGTQGIGEPGIATQTPTDSNSAKGDWNAAKTSDDGFQKLIGAIAGFIVFASIGGVVIFHNKEKLAKVFKFTHHSM